ncbi:Gfo/Idh/MocA family protein [Thalassoglobus sp.]|uniref:Gfo/Idh/MocA family protein n=1 Tax=Thalassoglobus sp. TaxID=2795869 RepID=UPI003AA899EB
MPTRRTFLQTTAATTFVAAAPAFVRGQNLNSKLQLAGIGCDGKGWSDINEMAGHDKTHHVAFCDIDLARTEKVHKLQPDAPIFQDYREMLEKLGDKIDGSTVSTPDHMHARITTDLMNMGKHVYCQKPLTHNVSEARQLRKLAKDSGVITRLGNQIHSHSYYRTAAKTIQDGAIGKVKEVRSWCAATGHGKSGYVNRPTSPIAPPETANWDLWVGVAPMRPYGDVKCYHPWGWRDWQDFGNGALGDFGCHIFDPVFTALNINNGPLSFSAGHTGMNDETWPAQTHVKYTFPGTEYTTGRSIPVSWDDGGSLPSTSGSHIPGDVRLPASGSILIGETGTMVIPHVGAMRLYTGKGLSDKEYPVLESLNHYHGWVDGCISGKQPSDGFEYGGNLTEAVLLGNIAVRYKGEKLNWNEKEMKITNNEEANKWLSREYRDGWKLDS